MSDRVAQQVVKQSLVFLVALGGGCSKHPAPSAVLTLSIEGMVCDSCAQAIQSELRRVPGVTDATVTFGSKRAAVRFSPDTVKPAALIEAIERLGYRARTRLPDAGANTRSGTAIDASRGRADQGDFTA